MDNNRRKHCKLRAMVDSACEGVMPHIEKRIKDAARRAYYLGAQDGMELAREKEEANGDNNDMAVSTGDQQ